MRKTVLWKEKEPTPEFYKPKTTRFGKSSTMKSKQLYPITRSKRFNQYDIDANRVGQNVGPGAYMQFHYSIENKVSKKPKIVKYFYRHNDLIDHPHYYRDYSNTRPNFLKSLSV